MEISIMERQEITNSLKKLKHGNQLGPESPDGMQAEIYRQMLDSETCFKTGKVFQLCNLCWGSPSEYWRKSRTVMVPLAKEFGPIALYIEYKIFMNIVKE